VPVGAVFPQAAPASGPAVFVADGGRARLQPVSVAARNGSEAWVTQGLEAGTPVLVYPPARSGGRRRALRPCRRR
jgi:HlyD family secretion protein